MCGKSVRHDCDTGAQKTRPPIALNHPPGHRHVAHHARGEPLYELRYGIALSALAICCWRHAL
jgi:hypothetical protein